MKKILTSCCLALAVQPFSFRFLEDVYFGIKEFENYRILIKSNSIDEVEDREEDTISSFYLYDKPTSVLLYEKKPNIVFSQPQPMIQIDEENKDKIVKLLLGNDKEFLENLIQEYQYEEMKLVDTEDNIHCRTFPDSPIDVLKINKQATTLSGVNIQNTENGVLLSKDGKSVNLQEALKLYGEQSLNDAINALGHTFITNFYKPYKSEATKREYVGIKDFEEKLKQRKNVPMDWDDLQRLKSCTILSVKAAISKKSDTQFLGEVLEFPCTQNSNQYNKSFDGKTTTRKISVENGLLVYENSFFSDGESYSSSKFINSHEIYLDKYTSLIQKEELMKLVGQKSVLVGLAKDNHTGKIFHWITDLKQDISVLMKYATQVNTDKNSFDLSRTFKKRKFEESS